MKRRPMVEGAISKTMRPNNRKQSARSTLLGALELKKVQDIQKREERPETPLETVWQANAAHLTALLATAQKGPNQPSEEAAERDCQNALENQTAILPAPSPQTVSGLEGPASDEPLVDNQPPVPAMGPGMRKWHRPFLNLDTNVISRVALTVGLGAIGAVSYLQVGAGQIGDDATAQDAYNIIPLPAQSKAVIPHREASDLRDLEPDIAVDRLAVEPSMLAPVDDSPVTEPTIASVNAPDASLSNTGEIVLAALVEPPPGPAPTPEHMPIAVILQDESTVNSTPNDEDIDKFTQPKVAPLATQSKVARRATRRSQNTAPPPVPGRNPFRAAETTPSPQPSPANWPVFSDVE